MAQKIKSSLFNVSGRGFVSNRMMLFSLSVVVMVAHSFSFGVAQQGVPKVNSETVAAGINPTGASLPLVTSANANSNKRVAKQVGSSPGGTVETAKDHESSGTHGFGHGFGHDHGHHGHLHHGYGDGKYFQSMLDKYYIAHGPHKYDIGWVGETPDGWEQRYERVDGHVKQGKEDVIMKNFKYAHVPEYGVYEYGYRRGNDYHFQERYEKGGPYWNFKTKVKWGDKYGGYGEHYWDYNHQDKGYDGGHGHGHGGDDGGHGHGHYSEPVPSYESKPGVKKNSFLAKRQSDKQNKTGEASTDPAKGDIGDDESRQDRKTRLLKKRQRIAEEALWAVPQISAGDVNNAQQDSNVNGDGVMMMPSLTLDPVSGKVYDETTGQAYWLKPAN